MPESDSIVRGVMVVALQYDWWQRAIFGTIAFGIFGGVVAVGAPYFWAKSSPAATAIAPAPPSTSFPGIEMSGNHFKNVDTIVRSDQNLPTMSLKDNDLDHVKKVFDLRSDPKK